jgi:hypothetical protein
MRSDIVQLPANVGVISARTNRETAATRRSSGGSARWAGDSGCPVAEPQIRLPHLHRGRHLAAKMLVRELGVGAMPQLWSSLSGQQ